ncbi:DUF167 family protein [Chthonobacter rhizosphaerae]|uniref:DUF167 family protein n=1 Tax=Chthonobacter rhizosphaerae TaxID=2735553 RepID=UPI0015EFC968|nr:DUF167 family protein [Chthonobacter rhizosphaerae]
MRVGEDLVLLVRLTPRGGRDALDGISTLSDGRTVAAARVRAPAEDGKANTALLALVAAAAGVPRSSVTLEAGATSRLKTVRIRRAGVPAEAALGAALAGP